MYKHIIFILLVSAIFAWINFDTYVMKSEPTLIEAISSILFVVIIFFYSTNMGMQSWVYFVLFISKYWVIGLFIYIVGYNMLLAPLFYPADFLLTVPIYGAIRYFFGVSPSVSVGIFSILFLYFTCVVGYFFGRLIKKYCTDGDR